VTLEEHLAAGYRHALRGGADPLPLAAKEVPKADWLAQAKALEPENLQKKDHVSRVRLQFVRRVLAMLG
jgi:hypothetical protein